MDAIITWVVLGLVAATLAKICYPRRIGNRNVLAIGLGIFGALIGGYLGRSITLESGAVLSASVGVFSVNGILFPVLGGMFLIFLWELITRANRAL